MRYFLGLQSSIIFPLGGSYGGRFDRFGVWKWGRFEISTDGGGVVLKSGNGVDFQNMYRWGGRLEKSTAGGPPPINGVDLKKVPCYI